MKTNLTVSMVEITPELAENYLKFNIKNRSFSESQLTFLAKEMRQGRFLENGESIVFDKNGELKDGQHRLKSIIISGKSYFIPVVRGVEPVSMATYDTGKNRTAGDVLTLNGFKYGNSKAALIIGINKFYNKKSKAAQLNKINDRKSKLTNHQVLEYCSNNNYWIDDMIKNIITVSKAQKPKVLQNTQLGIIAYTIGGNTPSKKVYDFIKHISGVSRTAESATNYLYTKLYNSKVNKEPLNFYWILAVSIKAWNFYNEGNPPVKYFKFNIQNDLPEINKEIN